MFPRKALARRSVFSYNNSVVVKRTEYIVEAVLIVNKDDFMSCKMLVVEIAHSSFSVYFPLHKTSECHAGLILLQGEKF